MQTCGSQSVWLISSIGVNVAPCLDYLPQVRGCCNDQLLCGMICSMQPFSQLQVSLCNNRTGCSADIQHRHNHAASLDWASQIRCCYDYRLAISTSLQHRCLLSFARASAMTPWHQMCRLKTTPAWGFASAPLGQGLAIMMDLLCRQVYAEWNQYYL